MSSPFQGGETSSILVQGTLPRWTSGLCRLPLKQEMMGSNPIRGTMSG